VPEALEIRRTVLTVSDVFLDFQKETVETVTQVALSVTRLKPGENERASFSVNANQTEWERASACFCEQL